MFIYSDIVIYKKKGRRRATYGEEDFVAGQSLDGHDEVGLEVEPALCHFLLK
jgi:hypothetical protein